MDEIDEILSKYTDGKELLDEIMRPLSLYVIYQVEHTFPVKRWDLKNAIGEDREVRERESELLGVADSLEDARKLIPAGLHNLGRRDKDDPAIMEAWI